jgi:hypothetical protein
VDDGKYLSAFGLSLSTGNLPASGQLVTIPRNRITVVGGGPQHRRGETMTTSNTAFASPSSQVSIPVREILPWAVLVGLLALLALYFVGAEEGATSLIPGMYVHEFVHDGRHLLGFPCH